MKYLLKLLFTIVLAFSFSSTIFAQEKPEAIVFSNDGCPYCQILQERIQKSGIESLLDIEIIKVSESSNLFFEKIGECELDPNTAGVPMVYRDGECAVGADQGMALLTQGFDEETLESVRVDEISQTIDTEEIKEEERNSTVFFVLGIVAILIIVVLFSYFKGKKQNVVNSIIALVTFSSYFALLPRPVGAICPVCTIAVGAGLGISRFLGIDDILSSLWIGGLLISSIMWFLIWLEGKGKKSVWIALFTYVGVIAMLFLTLYATNSIGIYGNTLWGMDKVILGMVIGALTMVGATKLHFYLKARNNDKVYFPYQKIAVVLGILILMTLVFYFITN